ncbi:MAG TPA: membrane protein insertase YidC [Gemmatimonadaceae bacterium]|nr:membrane protein insertase YidC [Gemmatimonadaceae bacterium]HRQ77035.1 membrane protein insertase YidC [Gemmatimonadaceae bacterium]
MDKRFFLAILLTGGVVLLTPVLFPRPSAPVPSAVVADSAATPSTTTSPTATPTVQGLPAPSAPTAIAPVGALGGGAPAAPVETLTVTNELTTFAFSTQGAQFLHAALPRFKRLGRDTGTVTLAHGREPLLRYTLLAGGDTLPLSTIPFTATRETFSSGERIRFDATVGTGTLRIDYALSADNYTATVRVQASGLPQPAFLLTQLPTGFDSQEADPKEDARHLSYAFKPVVGGSDRVDFRKPDPGERLIESGPFTWAVAKNKYFLVGLLTPEGQQSAFAELQVTGAVRENKIATRAQGVVVSPLADAPLVFELYAGPQEWERLVGMGREFEKTNPYGGWISGVVQPFATIVMRLLLWLKKTTALEYGWILVGFGVAIRLLMWPLNSRMMRTQIEMQRVAPLVQEAQNKHKGDPEKQRLAVMKVYADHNVSPFAALSGCLPMLLPMPILIALFFVFQNTIEFRGVSFLWLADISLKDPYYVLPLAMGASMYALSWLGMRNVPPNPQTKMMSVLMPVMMTVLLINFASGLNLYYTVQNLAALPQQWLISRERAKAATTTVVSGGGSARKR